MQLILFFVSIGETFVTTYWIANILLTVSGVAAKRNRKLLFAFLTGTIAHSFLIYGVFFIGGMVSFSPIVYLLVVTPSPFQALIFYYAAQRILGLSYVRSVKLMGYVYLIWLIDRTIDRVIGALFFVQNEARYNYLKDAYQQLANLVGFVLLYLIISYLIKHKHFLWRFSDSMFFDKKKELFIFMGKAIAAYAVMTLVPQFLSGPSRGQAMALLILILFLIISIVLDINSFNKQTIARHEMHISTLFKSLEEFQGIKHDFNNILHTYSGYIDLNEIDGLKAYHASLVSATSYAGTVDELAKKMQENPQLISLLISKLEYAEKKNVKLLTSLDCDLADMFIDNTDITRILSSLLDNAIEAASVSKARKARISVNSKTEDSKIIIIANSTLETIDPNTVMIGSALSHKGRRSDGLAIIRNTLGKYGNSSIQIRNYNKEFFVYLELKKSVS